jgi:DnaJ-class molecular chaperone
MKKKCPKCRGSGYIAVNMNRDYDVPDYDPMYVFKMCLQCMGKGAVNTGFVKYKSDCRKGIE